MTTPFQKKSQEIENNKNTDVYIFKTACQVRPDDVARIYDKHVDGMVNDVFSSSFFSDIKMDVTGILEQQGTVKHIILKHFSPTSDLKLIQSYPGIINCKRLYWRGKPTSSVKAQWMNQDDPPRTAQFETDGLLCTISPYVAMCCRCRRWGHIAKYCNRADACGICAGKHLTVKCSMKNVKKEEFSAVAVCVNCGQKGVI